MEQDKSTDSPLFAVFKKLFNSVKKAVQNISQQFWQIANDVADYVKSSFQQDLFNSESETSKDLLHSLIDQGIAVFNVFFKPAEKPTGSRGELALMIIASYVLKSWKVHSRLREQLINRARERGLSYEQVKLELLVQGVLYARDQMHTPQPFRAGRAWTKDRKGKQANIVPYEDLTVKEFFKWFWNRVRKEAGTALADDLPQSLYRKKSEEYIVMAPAPSVRRSSDKQMQQEALPDDPKKGRVARAANFLAR